MKIFLKKLLTKNNLFITLIIITAAFVRFYNFENRITFWSEQARSLIVSANYIYEKPSLLGQPYFIREDRNAHVLYSGALFNYSLIPLLFISNFEPVLITIFFSFINLLTGLIIYILVKKMFNVSIAYISSILFLFNDFMIYHSLFIWSYNYLPLIGIFTLYYSWRFVRNSKALDIFIVGLLCGIGISLQFLFAPIAVFVLFINIWKKKKWFYALLLFLTAMIIGNLPTVIFDIRHNFYETRTLFQYFLDTLQGRSNATFAYYYLLPIWPVAMIMGANLINFMWRKSKVITFIVILFYILFNLNSDIVNFYKPTGMPPGITVYDIDRASAIIASDVKSDFNIVEVLDFDKQAYVLRYYLQFKYGRKPLGIDKYKDLQSLYVLAQKEYNLESSGVWEIYAGGKYNIRQLSDVGVGYGLYKLSKN